MLGGRRSRSVAQRRTELRKGTTPVGGNSQIINIIIINIIIIMNMSITNILNPSFLLDVLGRIDTILNIFIFDLKRKSMYIVSEKFFEMFGIVNVC